MREAHTHIPVGSLVAAKLHTYCWWPGVLVRVTHTEDTSAESSECENVSTNTQTHSDSDSHTHTQGDDVVRDTGTTFIVSWIYKDDKNETSYLPDKRFIVEWSKSDEYFQKKLSDRQRRNKKARDEAISRAQQIYIGGKPIPAHILEAMQGDWPQMLLEAFDILLPKQLLCSDEDESYEANVANHNRLPRHAYGALHLMRFLFVLPKFLKIRTVKGKALSKAFQFHLYWQDFMEFVDYQYIRYMHV